MPKISSALFFLYPRCHYLCAMSMGEILMILFIYLLLFGAKGVPTMAKTLGKALYQFRNAAKDVQNEILKSADDMRRNAQVPLDQVVDFPTPPPQTKTYQAPVQVAEESVEPAPATTASPEAPAAPENQKESPADPA